MSTNAIIAKPEGDGWVGVYHHWDGYPAGLGCTLVTARDRYFAGDLDAMISYLIDHEMVGWSTINGADLTLAPEWHEGPSQDRPAVHGPLSYTVRGETPISPEGTRYRSSDNPAMQCGAEYAYVLCPGGVLAIDLHGNEEADTFCVLVPWNDAQTMMELGA